MNHSIEKAIKVANSIVSSLLFGKKNQIEDFNDLEEHIAALEEELSDEHVLTTKMQLWKTQDKSAQVERFAASVKAKSKKQGALSRKTYRLRYFLRYAAIVTLVLGSSLFIYEYYYKDSSQVKYATNGYAENKANLILHSGERIILKSNETIDLSKSTKLVVEHTTDAEKVKIEAKNVADDAESTLQYATLETPRGGGYTLELADGSIVKLNADSHLKFPSSFSGSRRVVYLDGEAYFEVTHNEKQPFIVITGDMSIEVLGTHFNVKGHDEDEEICTTLASGSVKVISPENKEVVLSPSEQSVFNKVTQSIHKQRVDVSVALSWIEGRFVFKDEPLEHILKQLSRWYDVAISYEEPSLKAYRFTGNINRFENINVILNMLNKTYTIHLKLEDKKVYVMKNNKLKKQ